MPNKWTKIVEKTKNAYASLEQAERIRKHAEKISESLFGPARDPKNQAIIADTERYFNMAYRMEMRAHRSLARLRVAG